MRNSSSLDWLRFMHTPNDYRVSHEGIAEIQISCGVYSLQDNLSKEKRMQMNTSTGKHLQFLTQMAMDSPVFKQLFRNYHNHYIQVESLVKQMAKEMDQQKQ